MIKLPYNEKIFSMERFKIIESLQENYFLNYPSKKNMLLGKNYPSKKNMSSGKKFPTNNFLRQFFPDMILLP